VAIPGAKPKEDRSQIRHRVPPAQGTEWQNVENVPFDGPALGDRPAALREVPDGVDVTTWPQATLDWWEDVRTMPHAILWTRADWAVARSAAEAHARFVEGWRGCASGAELRAREKQLGMYADARRDLRIRYVEPKIKPTTELPADVAKLDDYRGL
jgi:hypothetical protein